MTFADGLKITSVTTSNNQSDGLIYTVPTGSIARVQVRYYLSGVDRISSIALNSVTLYTGSAGATTHNPLGDFIYLDEGDSLTMTGTSGGSGGVAFDSYIETFNKP